MAALINDSTSASVANYPGYSMIPQVEFFGEIKVVNKGC